MNLSKALALAGAAAALTLSATGATLAWSVPVGTTTVSSCTQDGKLSNGSTFTLYTNVFANSDKSLYTYQYDLKNVSDSAGLTTFAANFGFAGDNGTSAQKIFFGDAPNSGGIVYHDGAVGSGAASKYGSPVVNNGSIDYNTHAPTMEAYSQNGQIVWQDTSAPLAAGQDMLSQLGYNGHDQYGSFGYLYVQSSSAPVQNQIYVADKNGASATITDCAGDSPCHGGPAAVPEPGSVASMGLGSLGLVGMLLRSRKRLFKNS